MISYIVQSMRNRFSADHLELMRTAEKRDRLLYTVNRAAAVLLASDEERFEDSLREGMELMARCMDVDRIYIWQNEIRDGKLYYVQKFEWLKDRRGNSVRSLTGFSYSRSIPEWEPKFIKGECVNGPLRTLSRTERERLEPYGIRSILVVPVHLKDRFLGFVSYDDCHQERTFTEDEVSILRSASLMMASAMIRNNTAAIMREADERAKIMLDATPLCCNLWDRDFNHIDCNEEAVKLFELGGKQEYLDRFFELSPKYLPDGRLAKERIFEYIKEAFESGRVVFGWIHQKLDGTLMPSEITLVRVRRGDGHIVAGYTRDLREYKKMMRELEYKDILMRMLNNVATILLQSEIDGFESDLWRCMGIMAGSVGADRMHIWKNHIKDGEMYCTQLYQWPEQAQPQQRGKYALDTLYRQNAPEWKEKLPKGKSINGLARDMSQGVRVHLAAQGILSILVVPVFLKDQFWGFAGFGDCHRERVFSADEEAILRSGSLLFAHALLRNEMTMDIRAAVEQAQAASRAKSKFLSKMSHEIRTPLNAITGMTLIGRSASDAKRKDFALEKIMDASNYLLGVINDILDMSKIEADKFELSNTEFNFEKMLQKVANVICFRIDEKKQRFAVFLDKDIPHTLIGDDQRLAQVITNLLSNAVKFTPERGSIRLDTHLEEEKNGVCVIRIEVTDTGIGIDPKRQQYLFDPFEQADSGISRQYGGTGLGLAISKHIVELMGGEIRIDSEPGRGSRFAFTIRAERGAKEYRDPLEPGLDRKNIRMLAVDGEPETRDYVAGIADRLGIACDTAAGGREALQLIDGGGAYTIYFVDWDMTDIKGTDLTRWIRARDRLGPVVAMIPAVDWSDIEEDARSAGVDKFLQKPLFPSSVADCINECLMRQSPPDAGDKPDEAVSFKGYRLLLAEDVKLNRDIVLTLLEPTELEIDCAENGREAMRMFAENPHRYDIIFMDVQMPEMDGLEATRRIRALGFQKAEQIPIVAMTANVFREDIEECMAAGMSDHVGKPLDFDEMFVKIKHYLHSHT